MISVSGPFIDKIDGKKQTVYPNYTEVLERLSEKGNLLVGIIEEIKPLRLKTKQEKEV